MMYRVEIFPHLLRFRRPAGTSRGVYTERKIWWIRLMDRDHPERVGWGECAPLPQLSCEDGVDYEAVLQGFARELEAQGEDFDWERLESYPSMAFGIETARLHLLKGSLAFVDNTFTRGESGIPINGLIWMGDRAYMYEQIRAKLEEGYRCVKLKIGAIGFSEELDLLSYIRKHYRAEEVELRVDANGAFAPEEAYEKLCQLSRLDIHSIEQPIAPKQWEAMAGLIERSPVPIALDEELIGCNDKEGRRQLLETLKPAFVVLKPSLHSGREHWVELAESMGIGWWATSALEGNIGLNAIAQWVSSYSLGLHQGLGTGQLFVENVPSPLSLEQGIMYFNPREASSPSCLPYRLT